MNITQKDKLIDKLKNEIVFDESGEWVFWPTHNKGYYKSEYLKIIADHLDKLNSRMKRGTISGDGDKR